jgi:hypothetical protein
VPASVVFQISPNSPDIKPVEALTKNDAKRRFGVGVGLMHVQSRTAGSPLGGPPLVGVSSPPEQAKRKKGIQRTATMLRTRIPSQARPVVIANASRYLMDSLLFGVLEYELESGVLLVAAGVAGLVMKGPEAYVSLSTLHLLCHRRPAAWGVGRGLRTAAWNESIYLLNSTQRSIFHR